MLPEHRAAFLGMAGIADLVHAVRSQQRSGGRAVRAVAVIAAHLALGHRHVRTLAELGALLPVAGLAGLGDAWAPQQACGGEARHRVVTVRACDLVGVMGRARPVKTLTALMAGQANGVLLLHWRAPLPREADQVVAVLVIVARHVQRAGTMAGFAYAPFDVVLRVQAEGLGVQGVAEVLGLDIVALGLRRDCQHPVVREETDKQQRQRRADMHNRAPVSRPRLHALSPPSKVHGSDTASMPASPGALGFEIGLRYLSIHRAGMATFPGNRLWNTYEYSALVSVR